LPEINFLLTKQIAAASTVRCARWRRWAACAALPFFNQGAKIMKSSKKNFAASRTGAGLISALLISSSAVLAGSMTPNYPALKAEAEKAREELRRANMEVPGLLTRLSTDRVYAEKYDIVTTKGDFGAITMHLKEGGAAGVGPVMMARRACYGGHVCVALPIHAAEVAQHRAEYEWVEKEADAFLDKLATDKVYGDRLDAAIDKGDREAIKMVLREGGLRRADISELSFQRDRKIEFHLDWIWWIIIEW
jgi:hypothetical protein